MDSIPHPWERALAAWDRARPLDWTSSFERTVWALTLGDRIFDLYAEALDVLRESRSPRYRGIAGRMAEKLERLNRVFGMAGVGAIAGWREPIYVQPPRLRSLLVKGRRGWPWGEDAPRLRRAPELAFWVGWPRVGWERPREKDGPAGMGERKR